MRLSAEPEGLRLEHLGRSVPVEEKDWLLLCRMTPQGRRLYIGRKGKLRLVGKKTDPEAELLVSWSKLPAKEWDFVCLPR